MSNQALLFFFQRLETPDMARAAIKGSLAKIEGEDFDWSERSAVLSADTCSVEQICRHLREVDRLLDGVPLSNSQKLQCKTAIDAIQILLSAPEPEWQIVVKICRSKSIAFLTSDEVTATANGLSLVQALGALLRLIAGS
jgi:hypothetical protein